MNRLQREVNHAAALTAAVLVGIGGAIVYTIDILVRKHRR